ncbi:DUF1870 family protein [Salmonella enterica subsp. enterica]|nr:DUF1870 family protein [Salmonella enterica subsp. enterica]
MILERLKNAQSISPGILIIRQRQRWEAGDTPISPEIIAGLRKWPRRRRRINAIVDKINNRIDVIQCVTSLIYLLFSPFIRRGFYQWKIYQSVAAELFRT